MFRNLSSRICRLFVSHDADVREDTFCVLPWIHLQIDPSGGAKLCCIASEYISRNDRPLQLPQVPYREIWNSRYLRRARRDMVEGRRFRACLRCFHEEKVLGVSRRLTMNQHWIKLLSKTREQFIGEAVQNDFRLPNMPNFLQLNMEGVCNLACRMCSGRYSSRIARDPVHNKWMCEPNHKAQWARHPVLFEEVLANPHEIKRLIVQGGEPLLLRSVKDLMDYLIQVDAAPGITLELVTNATVVARHMLERLARFGSVEAGFSVDGIEGVYEYIRYPARWSRVVENMAKFRSLSNASLTVNTVVMAYNLLNISDLFRFCDANGIGVFTHFLVGPQQLNVLVLPPTVRDLAKKRISECLGSLSIPQTVESAKYILTFLEQHEGIHWEDQLAMFMKFTNDMDRSRGQDFAVTHPELLTLLYEANYPWENACRYFK